MNIFLTTLGTSWAVIPELLHWLDDRQCKFYCQHPEYSQLLQQATQAELAPVDEVWVITTAGTKMQELGSWLSKWNSNVVLRTFIFPSEDLSSSKELRAFREWVFIISAHARQQSKKGKFWVSLAGGRKTMSADIQAAATFFGCDAVLHVLDRGQKGDQRLPEHFSAFLEPLPAEQIKRILPVIVEKQLPANAMTSDLEPPPLNSLHSQGLGAPCFFLQKLEQKLRESADLFSNYQQQLLQGEGRTNFLALYSLPESIIRKLRGVRIGVDPHPHRKALELNWLRALPKPELHCHLGGVLTVEEMIEVAGVHQHEIMQNPEIQNWLNQNWRPLIQQKLWSRIDQQLGDSNERWKQLRKPAGLDVPPPYAVCAFLLEFRDEPQELERLIYGDFLSEANFVGCDIEPYERLGDLQGSGLLQSIETIQATTRILLQKAILQNVRYLEIRCSPLNYREAGLSASAVVKAIEQTCEQFPQILTKLIFIGSRHGSRETLVEHIQLALDLHQRASSRLVAFDLAGNEQKQTPAAIREDFLPLLERCLQITIHAGETASAESIWEAVYHLQADRIGHGLKLGDHPELLRRFIDRKIAVEMCPSSNQQIVGFQDAFLPNTRSKAIYPLQRYLEKGLRVCVNTDNPGISRSDFTNELYRAARLTPGGLSPWEILQLLRNGFSAAFCEREERTQILRESELEIMRLLQSEGWYSLVEVANPLPN